MKKVLIIEDDPIAAKLYSGLLQKAGYETELAVDGQMGLERLYETRPDGVLLDLMLPKIGGIILLKAMRGLAEFESVPVIAYTNAFLPQVVEEASKAGANTVFDKATLTPAELMMEFKGAMQGAV
jgi:CheY-like chemotaxis protein